ncbi:hypothetical protein KXX06_000739 [Aspergillus fumigatus]|nr:hypothetical protein KXX06_000739 [Aspergillus fumigatus]
MKLMMLNQMALHQKPTINLSRLNDIKAVNQSARPSTRRPQRDPDEQSETVSENAEQFDPFTHRERRRRPRRRDEHRIVPFGADSVGREVGRRQDASGPLDNISNVQGAIMGQDQPNPAQPEKEQKKSKDNTLSLRLDLNLEIEVQLKARIHGDLTLSLLN